MTENKINPLLEAMNGIDDMLVCDTAKNTVKRKKRIGVVITAAAAAACTVALTTMAVANLKAPKDVLINDVTVQPYYSTYTADNGKILEVYITNIPDYALDEEVEGYTAVGEIKVVRNPEYPQKWGEWMLVDEAGNVFHTGINNKYVKFNFKGENRWHSFDVLNFSDDYSWIEIGTDSLSYYFVPKGQEEDVYREHGYLVYPF